jgi:hypothetical protein
MPRRKYTPPIDNKKAKAYVNRFDYLIDSSDSDSDDGFDDEKSVQKPIIENKVVMSEEENIVDNEKKYIPPDDIQTNTSTRTYVPNIESEDNSGWSKPNNKKRNFNRARRVKKVYDKLEVYDETKEYDGDNKELSDTWIVYTHKNSNSDWSISSYEPIHEIKTVGSLWRFLNVLQNLDKINYQYFIMRRNITPIWEDNKNRDGGICSIALDNRNYRYVEYNIGADAFRSICLLTLNESFTSNNEDINGLSYSIKNKKILIKLWISDYKKNDRFVDKLPMTILNKLDNIISKTTTRHHNEKDYVSIQYKDIKPDD